MAAITKVGLGGPMKAYGAFSAKVEAPAVDEGLRMIYLGGNMSILKPAPTGDFFNKE